MKYISRILGILGIACFMTACTDDNFSVVTPELPSQGDVAVNIRMSFAGSSAQTRSMVSGDEQRVHTMQMVCFDANGLYLGIRNAEVTSNGSTTNMFDTGIINGTVPQGTSRIHFIANRNLSVPLSFSVGTPEETVMTSVELSTKWDEKTIPADENAGTAAHQEVCYWGYHKAASAQEMEGWLKPQSSGGSTPSSSIVYMIRDRAKLVLDYTPVTNDPVEKIEWLIHNGNERGYLAPKSTDWESYYEDGKVAGSKIAKVELNQYNGTRYKLWSTEKNYDSEFANNVAYSIESSFNPETDSAPQFLFDDANTNANIVKIILKVKYTGYDNPRYHVLRLKMDEIGEDGKPKKDDHGDIISKLVAAIRNQTYYVELTDLDPNISYYTTLKDAVEGTEFVNAKVEIDRDITFVNDDDYTLQLLLKTETTSVVFNTVGQQEPLHFAFRPVNGGATPTGTTVNSFNVRWETWEDEGVDEDHRFLSGLELSYDEETDQFGITTSVKAGKLTDVLQDTWIEVEHIASGLTRYIHVYAINQFQFLVPPTLKAVPGRNGEYVLNFTIPKDELTQDQIEHPENYSADELRMYPKGLYPIDVRFTTNTLKAYGTAPGTDKYGSFGVAVEGTSRLTNISEFEKNTMQPSTTVDGDKTHWWYQQLNNWWDYWYTYSIKEYAQTSSTGEVNIYFKDVRDNIHYDDQGNTTNRVQDVGLFMEINYFGKVYSMPVTN